MKIRFIYLCSIACLVFAGCSDDDSSVGQRQDNKIYISQARLIENVPVSKSTSVLTKELTVSTSSAVSQNVDIVFKVDKTLISYYKQTYSDDDAIEMADENFTLTQAVAKISEGNMVSTPIEVQFTNLNTLDLNKRYVLPVTISEVSADIDIVNNAKTFFYIFEGEGLINVVADVASNKGLPPFEGAAQVTDMGQFTLEALVYPNLFEDSQYKYTSSIMGSTFVFLIRVGDIWTDSDQIEIAGSSVVTDPSFRLVTGKWQHIAVTFNQGEVKGYLDGVLKCSGTLTEKTVNFALSEETVWNGWEWEYQDKRFWLGHSYAQNRYFDGSFSEFRMWNKALSVEEINEPLHFYDVNPASENLIAYWKFNDGNGSIVKDYSSYKCDAVFSNVPSWKKVVLPE